MDAMKRDLLGAVAVLAVGLSAVAVLGGCGSQTKTVTATGAPAVSQTASAATQPANSTPATTSTPANTTPAQATTAGGTAAPGTTRTAPEPAFTGQEAHAEGVSAAAALVRSHGYTPNDTSEYHEGQTLRVLVGTRTGSGDGYGQQAFFFVGGRYIGTDTKEASATVKVLSQSDTEVTLAYPLYRKNDALCCPGAGQARVRFALDNGELRPLDPVPPAHSTNGLSRY